MIKYDLACADGHGFEAWFRSSDAYDRQSRRKLVSCPQCGSTQVEKQPMAPAVVRRSSLPSERARLPTEQAQAAPAPASSAPAAAAEPPLEMLRAFRRHVLANSEDVGRRFAEEARAIHHGEAQERAIRGATSHEEAAQLHDEGITFGIIPALPEDQN